MRAVGGQSSTGGPTFTYQAPTLTALSPSNGPTAGGYALTITGTNFALAGDVKIDGLDCPLTGAGWGHSRIECTVPANFNTNKAVVVTASTGGNRATAGGPTFSYDAPVLTLLSPNNAPTRYAPCLGLASVLSWPWSWSRLGLARGLRGRGRGRGRGQGVEWNAGQGRRKGAQAVHG